MATSGNKHEIKSGKPVVTPKARMSYPHLFEPNTQGEYPSNKYEVTLLIPKSANIEPLRAEVLKVAKEAFPGKNLTMEQLAFSPIRDGDAEEKGGEYKGHWFLKAKSGRAPALLGADTRPLSPLTAKELVYGGAFCHVKVRPFSYVQAGRPGVTWSLEAVQVLPGGERFGGGSGSASDGFTAFEDAMGSGGFDGETNI